MSLPGVPCRPLPAWRKRLQAAEDLHLLRRLKTSSSLDTSLKYFQYGILLAFPAQCLHEPGVKFTDRVIELFKRHIGVCIRQLVNQASIKRCRGWRGATERFLS